MDLDELKQTWAEHDRKLDLSIRLNQRLLLATSLDRLRWPLRRFAFLAGLGALIGLIGPVILGQFIYQHWKEPRFAVPAALLDAWLIASVAAAIRQMVSALQIDYDQPVTVIQKQLESLRVLRIRIMGWALLTGQLIWWTPFLIVALKGFWDVDAYQTFGAKFLLLNLAVGLAIIPLLIWASKLPAVRRLSGTFAGYNLDAASAFLATLREFENSL